ncbi:hypothetical protein C21_02637 [Arenibacter sp. NBRC 103722]|nr:hypothetical protein C21_02637 [Arenibacter sp. NBRC 103722]
MLFSVLKVQIILSKTNIILGVGTSCEISAAIKKSSHNTPV